MTIRYTFTLTMTEDELAAFRQNVISCVRFPELVAGTAATAVQVGETKGVQVADWGLLGSAARRALADGQEVAQMIGRAQVTREGGHVQ